MPQDDPVTTAFQAHSLVTRDGRHLVSREGVDGRRVFSLAPEAELPPGTPPPREWTLYVVKSTHADIGLHNEPCVQRHGAALRLAEAARLVAADPDDSDPAAFRYVAESAWFWECWAEDNAARFDATVLQAVRRGRIGVGCGHSGNHTHLFGFEELCRFASIRRKLEERWGIRSRTMVMADNPGLSWSLVAPCAEAGVEHVLFAPNQWNPHPSTIWTRDEGKYGDIPLSAFGRSLNPDAGGGGARIDVRWGSALPKVFWWEAPQGGARLLVWCSTMYARGGVPFGFKTSSKEYEPPAPGGGAFPDMEARMALQLARMEAEMPYDIWLLTDYGDDEIPATQLSDLCKAWNAKWRWPQLRTVGDLDEPFDRLKARWGAALPVVRGEMASGWLQHAIAAPDLLARKFAADRALPAAEAARTAESSRSDAADASRIPWSAAWRALLCYDEHSYGVSGYQGRRVFETWLQKRDWLETAETAASLGSANAPGGQKIEAAPGNGGVRVLENRWYRAVVRDGMLLSLHDKDLRRELLSAPAGVLLYTRDNHATWERDPAAALGAAMVQTVALCDDEKKIILETRLRHCRDLFNGDRYKRYGYMAFPFAVPQFRFASQLNGPVIDPLRDQSGFVSDAFVAVRDWCAAENGEFGVALAMADASLAEFGEIHPDKTCFGGAARSSGIFAALFNDWLQMHVPDGDSIDLRFRFAITSYAGSWQGASVPRFAERAIAAMDGVPTVAEAAAPLLAFDAPNVRLLALKDAEDGRGLIARFKETCGRPARVAARHSIPAVTRLALCTIDERNPVPLATGPDGRFAFDIAPFGYATVRFEGGRAAHLVGEDARAAPLLRLPRATHGEKAGQLYLCWPHVALPGLDHYEVYRSAEPGFEPSEATLAASVEPGPYCIGRHEDTGLASRTRYYYRVRAVASGGAASPFSQEFSAITRA